LQLDEKSSFQTPSEAQMAFETVLISERSYVTTPAKLEEWVTLLGGEIEARRPRVTEPEAETGPVIESVEAVDDPQLEQIVEEQPAEASEEVEIPLDEAEVTIPLEEAEVALPIDEPVAAPEPVEAVAAQEPVEEIAAPEPEPVEEVAAVQEEVAPEPEPVLEKTAGFQEFEAPVQEEAPAPPAEPETYEKNLRRKRPRRRPNRRSRRFPCAI
jgi:hypothetical protein